jgi:hypothetical protein
MKGHGVSRGRKEDILIAPLVTSRVLNIPLLVLVYTKYKWI